MGRKNWGDIIGRRLMLCSDAVYFICAFAILILAIISSSKVHTYETKSAMFDSLNLLSVLRVVIFIACLGLVGSSLGFAAVLKQWKKMLVVTIMIMIVVFIVQIVMGLLLLMSSTNSIYEVFREDSVNGYSMRLNFEVNMKCCGWHYITEEFFPERTACIALHPTFTMTCQQATTNFLNDWAYPSGVVLLVLAFVAAIALVGSLMVVSNNQANKEDFFENPFSF